MEKRSRYTVNYGEPVGMIAAQSLGEPGTQMILRAFHFAGIESTIATSGLPRIVELVDARKRPATPITYVSLKGDAKKSIEKADYVLKQINEIKVSSIVRRALENFSKGMIKLVLDEQAVVASDLTPAQIAQKISKKLEVAARADSDRRSIMIRLKTKKQTSNSSDQNDLKKSGMN